MYILEQKKREKKRQCKKIYTPKKILNWRSVFPIVFNLDVLFILHLFHTFIALNLFFALLLPASCLGLHPPQDPSIWFLAGVVKCEALETFQRMEYERGPVCFSLDPFWLGVELMAVAVFSSLQLLKAAPPILPFPPLSLQHRRGNCFLLLLVSKSLASPFLVGFLRKSLLYHLSLNPFPEKTLTEAHAVGLRVLCDWNVIGISRWAVSM